MMTLSAIDQALNVALTGIVYGSVTWTACAFGVFVITQQRKRRACLKASAAVPLLAPTAVSALQLEPASEPAIDYELFTIQQLEQPVEQIINQPPLPEVLAETIEEKADIPGIEIIIEPPPIEPPPLVTTQPEPETQPEPKTGPEPEVDNSHLPLPNSQIELPVIKPARKPTKKRSVKQPVSKPVSEQSVAQKSSAQKAKSAPEPQAQKKNQKSGQKSSQKSGQKKKTKKREPQHREPQTAAIVCEPVNWKKWRVADLRKASIANVCGVRTRPIGSKRNLLKADLIAQYEQQLKRMTKPPTKSTKAREEVA